MSIVICGFGNIGKNYLKILKQINYKNTIYVIDKTIIRRNKSKNIIFLNSDFFFRNIKKNKNNYAIICSPSYLHYDHAKIFIINQYNVLIEKPLVLKYENAIRLVNLAKKYKSRVWVMFQNRANEPIVYLKKNIEKKNIGSINIINANLYWHRNHKYYSDDWHGSIKKDGGVLVNQSIHLLDIIIYLFGEIDEFKGFMIFNKKKLEAEDLISLNLISRNNILINFLATTRANLNYEMSLDILSDKKRISIEGSCLNKYYEYKDLKKIYLAKNSFITRQQHGNKHKLILNNFLNTKKDYYNLNIKKNLYLIKLINSIYNYLYQSKGHKVNKTKSILGT